MTVGAFFPFQSGISNRHPEQRTLIDAIIRSEFILADNDSI
jgi:hypothetical protein